MKSMDYWNLENFNGLKDIANRYSADAAFVDFAQYCSLKEQGLKKPALNAINRFIALTSTLPLPEQRDMVLHLSHLAWRHRHVHQLIAYPLHQYLSQMLSDWVATAPTQAEPYRWLGYFSQNPEWFSKALQYDATDQISLQQLIGEALAAVDHQTHHLFESRFIGDVAQAQQSLAQAAQYITRLTSVTQQQQLSGQCAYYQRLISCWLQYQQTDQPLPFSQWCVEQGESFSFEQAFYYQ